LELLKIYNSYLKLEIWDLKFEDKNVFFYRFYLFYRFLMFFTVFCEDFVFLNCKKIKNKKWWRCACCD